MKDGQLSVVKFPRDGSGLISSLRDADGLLEVSEEVSEVREGDMVNFIPFVELWLACVLTLHATWLEIAPFTRCG